MTTLESLPNGIPKFIGLLPKFKQKRYLPVVDPKKEKRTQPEIIESQILTKNFGFTIRCALNEKGGMCKGILKGFSDPSGLLIVRIDESWVSSIKTKEQSKELILRGDQASIKSKVINSDKKIMIIPFFDKYGLIYPHYVPKGQTVNSDYLIHVMKPFLNHFGKKNLELKTGK
ncbi:unnamed protein product [Lepeophtheirus salmonis]|uniref:(salmon louse) hypothetical protein n=1 Tax=Lepeophtheirus salmonis TaxID=72036 RepID=A0A817FDM6_LEPSM|nr:unnamed protein product [Lepeophtheirus salmonis]